MQANKMTHTECVRELYAAAATVLGGVVGADAAASTAAATV